MKVGSKFLIFPITQVVPTPEIVADAKKHMFVANRKEIGAGHVFVIPDVGHLFGHEKSEIVPLFQVVGFEKKIGRAHV